MFGNGGASASFPLSRVVTGYDFAQTFRASEAVAPSPRLPGSRQLSPNFVAPASLPSESAPAAENSHTTALRVKRSPEAPNTGR